MLSVKIYGVESRRAMVEKTAAKLGLSERDIFYDDRPNGGDVLYTAKKAWLSDHGDASHAVVLQDDCEVCNGFLSICERIAAAHPRAIVSLFPFDYMREDPSLDLSGSPYFNCRGVSGVGIIMPTAYIEPCFSWIGKALGTGFADDDAISIWARREKIEMITTLPSPVQHIGDESVLGEREVRRTFYYDADPEADWENGTINRIVRSMPAPSAGIKKSRKEG